MTFRELTAMVLLYRACRRIAAADGSRIHLQNYDRAIAALRRARELVPELEELVALSDGEG